MSKVIKSVLLSAAAALLTGACAGALAQPAGADVSFEAAYSRLSQHGTWLASSRYGRVWQPGVYDRSWNPYYDGHWVHTELGWAWVSDYAWGAIPYHYGTWAADPQSGWVWIPGNVWAPAWVVFRTGSGFIGWAPVPVGYTLGASIDIGVSPSFVFVASREFLTPRIRTSVVSRARTIVFINDTVAVNNIRIENGVVVNPGPDVAIVERATGRSVRTNRIESVAGVASYDPVSRARLAGERRASAPPHPVARAGNPAPGPKARNTE